MRTETAPSAGGRSREELGDQELIDLVANSPAIDSVQIWAAVEILERRLIAAGVFGGELSGECCVD